MGGLKLHHSFAVIQAHAAGVLHDVARKRRLPGLDRMAHGVHRLPPAPERDRDLPMDGPEPLRRLAEVLSRAMLPDERMQPPHLRCAIAHRLEQPGKDRHRVDPAHRITALQHLVEQRRVHPLEQADIEQELPILRLEARKQPRLHPVLHQLARSARIVASAPLQLVPGEPEREWPAGRLRHHRVQSPAGQPAVEEVRGLSTGEPQIVRRQDFGLAVQHGAGDVYPGGKLAPRKSQAQVRRAVP